MIVEIFRAYKNGKKAKRPLYNVQVKNLDQAEEVFWLIARKDYPENWGFEFREKKEKK